MIANLRITKGCANNESLRPDSYRDYEVRMGYEIESIRPDRNRDYELRMSGEVYSRKKQKHFRNADHKIQIK